MVDINWQDPPPAKGRTARAFPKAVQDALRAEPGRWALIGRSRHTGTASTRKATYGSRGFEFAQRTVPGTNPPAYDLYARYNPEAQR